MRQLAKQAVGERAVLSQGRGARMVSDHFLAHCVCSGRREPYGTPFLPPAGGANRGANGKEKGAHFVGAPLLAPPAGLEPATT